MKHKSWTTHIKTEAKEIKAYKKRMKDEGWNVIDEYTKGTKITVVFER